RRSVAKKSEAREAPARDGETGLDQPFGSNPLRPSESSPSGSHPPRPSVSAALKRATTGEAIRCQICARRERDGAFPGSGWAANGRASAERTRTAATVRTIVRDMGLPCRDGGGGAACPGAWMSLLIRKGERRGGWGADGRAA